MLQAIIPLISLATTIFAATSNSLPPEVAHNVMLGASTVGSAAMLGAIKPPEFASKLVGLREPENRREFVGAPGWVKTISTVLHLASKIVDVIGFNWGRAANQQRK
jgi:hypothetical protein